MARVARREQQYDFASFDEPPSSRRWLPNEDWDTYRTTAFLAIREGHAVAYAVVRLRKRQLLLYADGKEVDPDHDAVSIALEPIVTARPCVDLIFTAGAWRRQGLMRTLVVAILTHYAVPHAADLLWGLPFSDKGLATILSLTQGRIWGG
jgi:hypothetical protein